MALVPCTECGVQISALAKACPKCGCPVKEPLTYPNRAGGVGVPQFRLTGRTKNITVAMMSDLLSASPNGGEEKVLAAGRIGVEYEWVWIVIPLYFNRISSYMIFTDQRLILGVGTLWGSRKIIFESLCKDVHRIDVTPPTKKFWTLSKEKTEASKSAQIVIRRKEGEPFSYYCKDFAFIQEAMRPVASAVPVYVAGKEITP